MKKVFLTALIALSLITSSFAAEGSKVTLAVTTKFQDDFGSVKDVQWTSGTTYSTATFTLENKRTNAFYEADGRLIGTSQAVTIESLPSYAKRLFAKKYADFTVTEAIQFDVPNEAPAYFVSAAKDGKTVIVKIANGAISLAK